MNRPYIICHILSALNGKIAGAFMGTVANRKASEEYGRIREAFGAQAWIYGTTTTKEFTRFRKPDLSSVSGQVPDGDYVAESEWDLYYVTVGQYTDIYFPDHNVRFIAINDLVDSDEGENEIAPFKNVMNEMYARDISRKVRSVHRIRGTSGEPLSQPPYGYMKSPENKRSGSLTVRYLNMCKS